MCVAGFRCRTIAYLWYRSLDTYNSVPDCPWVYYRIVVVDYYHATVMTTYYSL